MNFNWNQNLKKSKHRLAVKFAFGAPLIWWRVDQAATPFGAVGSSSNALRAPPTTLRATMAFESPRALRGCMVLQTNCIFDALCVFDAIRATCCLIEYSELLTIIDINRFSLYENTLQLHGTRHFVKILNYISDYQISFQSTTNLRGKQEKCD